MTIVPYIFRSLLVSLLTVILACNPLCLMRIIFIHKKGTLQIMAKISLNLMAVYRLCVRDVTPWQRI